MKNYESEQIIQQALQKYHELIDSIDGIVWEADTNFHFTFVSKQAERLLGYSIEEWVSDPDFLAKIIYPEDLNDAYTYCKSQCELLRSHELECRFMAKDGTVKWLRDNISVVTQNNTIAGLRGIMVDITQEKKAQGELKEALSLLSATLDATADAIIVFDLEGRIKNFNQPFIDLWKIPSEILHSHDVMGVVKFISSQLVDPVAFKLKVEECFSEKSTMRSDQVEFVDGRVFERVSKPHVLNGTIIGRVTSFRNITERVHLERQKEHILKEEVKGRLEAEKSIKLRDDFLSIASHELKTPLTPIRMQLRLLKRLTGELFINGSLPSYQASLEKIHSILESADQQFSRFLKLVEDLLDVSRITAERLVIHPEEFDFSILVNDSIKFHEIDFKKAGCEVTNFIEENIVVKWDKTRIEQVMTNLFSNARKYGGGSPITISLNKNKLDDGSERVIFIIEDKGIGIAETDHEKIFGRFERVAPTESYGGLGLGLYITYNIVVAHGGTIRVESKLGKGAKFIIDLPVVSKSEP